MTQAGPWDRVWAVGRAGASSSIGGPDGRKRRCGQGSPYLQAPAPRWQSSSWRKVQVLLPQIKPVSSDFRNWWFFQSFHHFAWIPLRRTTFLRAGRLRSEYGLKQRCHLQVPSRHLLASLPAGREPSQLAAMGRTRRAHLCTLVRGLYGGPDQSKELQCLYGIVKIIPPWGKGFKHRF